MFLVTFIVMTFRGFGDVAAHFKVMTFVKLYVYIKLLKTRIFLLCADKNDSFMRSGQCYRFAGKLLLT